ncbi:ASCH domain-containing protein [Solibacillus sp. FSL H8-0538]|uniref:ASCH domain-containing protein n=1 Tax=Solibacillus sp. FSL H8-0538 TaxID=2921400 RepID=UPI004046F9FB
MTMTIQQFWDNYWQQLQKPVPPLPEAFQFGSDADWLAQLVVEGKKTATCSGHLFYELENEPLPQVGQYNIVLNASDEPVAIIKNVGVMLSPMKEVPIDFALAEGEGEYHEWWNGHVNFFTAALAELDLPFTENLLLVCERFEVLYPAL